MLVADDHELVPQAPSPKSSPSRADGEKSTTAKFMPPIVIVASGMSVGAFAGLSAVMAGGSNWILLPYLVARTLATVTYVVTAAPRHSFGAQRSDVDVDQRDV